MAEAAAPIKPLFQRLREGQSEIDIRVRADSVGFVTRAIGAGGDVAKIMMVMCNEKLGDTETLQQLRDIAGPPEKKDWGMGADVVASADASQVRVGPREASRVLDIKPALSALKRAAAAIKYLDVGCAEGKITAAVAAAIGLRADQVHACDVVPAAAARTGFAFRQVVDEKLPYDDAEFDLLTMFMSAHHFRDQPGMLKEALRVLKPGGRLIMREHDCYAPARSIYYDIVHATYAVVTGDEATPEQFAAQITAGYATYWPAKKWIALMKDAGFSYARAQPHNRPDRMDAFYAIFERPKN